MSDRRENARQVAITAREDAAAKAQRIMETTDSAFREAVMVGIARYRKIFDSDSAMARTTGVSQPTINKVLSGKQDPRLDAVGKIMDSAGATVVFPWEARNETRKISLAGGANTADFRAVKRFEYDKMAVAETDDTPIILPLANLREMSETLSIGAFILEEGTLCPAVFEPGDTVLVDFSSKPGAEETGGAFYLAGLKNGGMCVAAAWEGKFVIDFNSKVTPEKGIDYDAIGDAAIGKVVMHMRIL